MKRDQAGQRHPQKTALGLSSLVGGARRCELSDPECSAWQSGGFLEVARHRLDGRRQGLLSRMLLSSPWNRAVCLCKRQAGCWPCTGQETLRELGQGLPRIPEFPESKRGVRPLPPGKSSGFSQQWLVLAPGNSILRVLKEPCLGSGWVTDY